MNLSHFKILLFIAAIFYVSMPSYAAENIDFIDKERFNDRRVETHLSDHSYSSIAPIDLNNDSIDEYILSQTLGEQRFQFDVMAATDAGLVEIGSFTGLKLMIAYSENHGVRSILNFNDADNDFKYDVYEWSAVNSRFMHERDVRKERSQ